MKWEYHTWFVGSTPAAKLEHDLNEWGKHGWELVSVSDKRAYFKRPRVLLDSLERMSAALTTGDVFGE